MILEKIQLLNFNNYTDQLAEFGLDINCLAGPNGSGKTNLLDAIYYLALTKSAFNKTDGQTVKHAAPFFSVSGQFLASEDNITIQCSFKVGEKKVVKANKLAYTRLSDHIGKIPVVLATPDDTDIIREGGEERRKFFDGILSQTDHEYLEHLMRYNSFLTQRNSLLRAGVSGGPAPDKTLLDTYDAHLVTHADALYSRRKTFVQLFEPIFNNIYNSLSNGQEVVSLVYNTQLHSAPIDRLLKQVRNSDIMLGRSTAGPHKDDYIFTLGEHPLKKFGSQGQQKTFVIALKLAQYMAMLELNGQKPILLLDDVFDKLDDDRIERLLKWLQADTIGQVFITDARPERSIELLANLNRDTRFFNVSKGVLEPREL